MAPIGLAGVGIPGTPDIAGLNAEGVPAAADIGIGGAGGRLLRAPPGRPKIWPETGVSAAVGISRVGVGVTGASDGRFGAG